MCNYVWAMYVCVRVRSTIERGNQTWKRGKNFRKCWRTESGRKSGQFLAGLLAGLWCSFEKKMSFVSASYPARNPAWNPARNRPDCDRTAGLTSVFSSFLSLLSTKISHFSSCSAVSFESKERKNSSIFIFDFCFNLEISPIDFETPPYKWSSWKVKACGWSDFEGEAFNC